MSLEEKVEVVMSSDVATIETGRSAKEAAAVIPETGCLIVLSGMQPLGIVTENDIVKKVTARGSDPSKVVVGDIMSTPIISVKSKSSIKDAAEIITRFKVKRLAVISEDSKCVGILTTEDIARWLAKQSDYEDPALNALARIQQSTNAEPYR